VAGVNLFHIFLQNLLKQLKDKGTEDPGGERALVVDLLIEAAESLGEKLVLGILHGVFDWNSHACSSLVLENPKLVAAMLERGYVHEAKALDAISGEWMAWCKPHSTEADQTRKLHLLGVLISRLFGKNLYDTGVLASSLWTFRPGNGSMYWRTWTLRLFP
jgi:hypothetical protein